MANIQSERSRELRAVGDYGVSGRFIDGLTDELFWWGWYWRGHGACVGTGGIWEIAVPSAQFGCGPKLL